MVKVYIDGQEGTTGLKILDRFNGRTDIELIRIDSDKRKDAAERKRLINESDFTFLCLPDAAAIEAVSLAENPNVRIIDASTAHRTNPAWHYGLPELSPKQREGIATSKRVAVPGCFPSGFVSLMAPLINDGILQPHYPVFTYALTGYSGGGNQRIAQYEDERRARELESPMIYGLAQNHKHIPEMLAFSGLAYRPMFTPVIADFYSGMTVVVPIQARLLHKKASIKEFWEVLRAHYQNSPFISVKNFIPNEEQTNVLLPSNYLRGTNKMDIYVFGSNEQILLCACLDNLGKGASGAAVQCLNIMMGIDETTGLL